MHMISYKWLKYAPDTSGIYKENWTLHGTKENICSVLQVQHKLFDTIDWEIMQYSLHYYIINISDAKVLQSKYNKLTHLMI